ncbi:acyltransferase [Vibrio sp. F13]|uniref:acyltransferase family protein n=1 Tax=Vibrio sp. F13 TaxID=2070777 RepID=UPI0010BD03EE|nr:acyltransferase [Vibrio sp. F13]TKF64189.1 acyltransferase [Vibrio sp. F13]
MNIDRITLLRFPLICLIILIHAFSIITENVSDESIFYTISFVVSQLLARSAVPLFFIFSGFLFFWGVDFSKTVYISKIKKRVRSVLVPYLFWNLLLLLMVNVVVYMAPYFNVELSKNILNYQDLTQLPYFIFLDRYPIAYHFWFIRDLIILMVFSPLIYIMLKLKLVSKIIILLLFLIWIFNFNFVAIPDVKAVLFYMFGAYLAINNVGIFRVDKHVKQISAIYLVSIILFILFVHTSNFLQFTANIIITLGCVSLFVTAKYIKLHERLNGCLLNISKYSFFVFCIHEPMLTAVKKINVHLLSGREDYLLFISFFLVALIVVITSVSLAKFLERYFPRFYSALSGN